LDYIIWIVSAHRQKHCILAETYIWVRNCFKTI